MLSEAQIQLLQEIAEKNDGHCDRCHRIIKIYRYRVNQQIATILRAMRKAVDDTGENKVNFDQLDIPYRLGSQRTKMRLHGLIAKCKDENGKHIANTWLITKKGGDFLRGEAIPEKVVAFDNQVLGHEGKLVTIQRLMNESEFEAEPITTPEAEVYSEARQPKRNLVLDAINRRTGASAKIVLERLALGQPVEMITPKPITYPDIAAFQRDWQVVQ